MTEQDMQLKTPIPQGAADKKRFAAEKTTAQKIREFPYWLVALGLCIATITYVVIARPNFTETFLFIKDGLQITVLVTLASYAIALVIGLLVGLGRISKNVVINNIATFYVEFIRGVPMLVLLFFLALVGFPILVEGLNAIFGLNINIQGIPMSIRAIFGLAITYGAFMAEIFRAGIQSIDFGQTEAARSLGMSQSQAMRYIILPQAIRNVLPALGNDFVAMVKDSSLVSVLAVRDVTQLSRLYAGRTFRFREAYIILVMIYLTITVFLSLGVNRLEKAMRSDD